jgi:hypothetical protein
MPLTGMWRVPAGRQSALPWEVACIGDGQTDRYAAQIHVPSVVVTVPLSRRHLGSYSAGHDRERAMSNCLHRIVIR